MACPLRAESRAGSRTGSIQGPRLFPTSRKTTTRPPSRSRGSPAVAPLRISRTTANGLGRSESAWSGPRNSERNLRSRSTAKPGSSSRDGCRSRVARAMLSFPRGGRSCARAPVHESVTWCADVVGAARPRAVFRLAPAAQRRFVIGGDYERSSSPRPACSPAPRVPRPPQGRLFPRKQAGLPKAEGARVSPRGAWLCPTAESGSGHRRRSRLHPSGSCGWLSRKRRWLLLAPALLISQSKCAPTASSMGHGARRDEASDDSRGSRRALLLRT